VNEDFTSDYLALVVVQMAPMQVSADDEVDQAVRLDLELFIERGG
jgi:hypothetical protein